MTARQEALHSDPTDLSAALTDPAQAFKTPSAVVADEAFSRSEKIEILRRWDYDAREASVASDEGMPNGDDSPIGKIYQALGMLGAEYDLDQEPPTRQGGVLSGGLKDTPSADLKGAAIKEAVAVFHKVDALEAAIDDLEEHGYDRATISLLAGDQAVREKLHRYFVEARDVEDNPHAPRAAYVSQESVGAAEGALIGGALYVAAVPTAGAVIAGGGPMGAAIVAACLAGGVGATIGGVLAKFLDVTHADYLNRQLDRGGITLWVRTTDPEKERHAIEILKSHAGDDVHLHAMPYGAGRKIDYRGDIIEEYQGGCFTADRLFPSLKAAEEFIDEARQENRTEP